jgi:hypothetical protein
MTVDTLAPPTAEIDEPFDIDVQVVRRRDTGVQPIVLSKYTTTCCTDTLCITCAYSTGCSRTCGGATGSPCAC